MPLAYTKVAPVAFVHSFAPSDNILYITFKRSFEGPLLHSIAPSFKIQYKNPLRVFMRYYAVCKKGKG